ncbi:MAG TPA: cysteine methyltransferase [Anaerolineae bacterium]|nr:cysteine methyltransferase [Anaerolineae bacterium]HIP71221.1 cysteine methyltransferase [Anaerolineae bacterium]
MSTSSNFYVQVYQVTQRIPVGKVTSYGRIAQMLGRPHAARAVGYALSALKDADSGAAYTSETVPWQRVVNSQGRISIVNREHTAVDQAHLLREEGVAVDENGRIDLNLYLWGGLHLVELDDILRGDR